jgi:hypothetical protein
MQDKRPVGYFTRHNGVWVLVNQNIPDLEGVTEKQTISVGQMLVIIEINRFFCQEKKAADFVLSK